MGLGAAALGCAAAGEVQAFEDTVALASLHGIITQSDATASCIQAHQQHIPAMASSLA
jgi:hypothetical protein